MVRGRKGKYDTLLADLATQGYARARIDGEMHDLTDPKIDALARYEQHTIEVIVDRLVKREGIERRLTDSLETALRLADGVAEVQLVPAEGEEVEEETLTFSQHLACPVGLESYDELAPRNFSFNSPYGACEHCDGLGTRFEVDPELVVPNPDLSVAEGAIQPWARPAPSTSSGCSSPSPRTTASTPTSRGASSRRSSRTSCCTARRATCT